MLESQNAKVGDTLYWELGTVEVIGVEVADVGVILTVRAASGNESSHVYEPQEDCSPGKE